MKWIVVFLAALAAPAALSWDSGCKNVDGEACSSLEAARLPWENEEHARLWLETRALAGLPASVDADFRLRSYVSGDNVDATVSLSPAPYDAAFAVVERDVTVAQFAMLPDFSFALWDWASGNEGCPPAGTSGGPELCHLFEGHLSWLNASHFLPMAGDAFVEAHTRALGRARACAAIADAVGSDASFHAVELKACDREALAIEAMAQHYLQDAWSVGHMWQRWGAADVDAFLAARGDVDLETLALTVGKIAGILHGAKGVDGIDDALCAPGVGIEFVLDGAAVPGAGDLFLDAVDRSGLFEAQSQRMLSCLASAQREVYEAGAGSLGPLEPAADGLDVLDPASAACLGQRATNRAIFLAAGIDLADDFAINDVERATLDALLVSAGVDPAAVDGRFVPLTAEALGRVLVDDFGLRLRFAEDMRLARRTLDRGGRTPEATTLADGGLGPLLGMQPNGAYDIGAANYFDPPLPWTPTAISEPLTPTIENAANILPRVFLDAHADDWCDAIDAASNDELSLAHLSDRCIELTTAADGGSAEAVDLASVACGACADLARWFVFSIDSDDPKLAALPLCSVLAGAAAHDVHADDGDDRNTLALRFCHTAPDRCTGSCGLTESEEVTCAPNASSCVGDFLGACECNGCRSDGCSTLANGDIACSCGPNF